MIRLFLGMAWVAYTPQPAIFDLRRSIIGGITIHDPGQRSTGLRVARLLSFRGASPQPTEGSWTGSCNPGGEFLLATRPRCRSRSRGSVPCDARAVTPTAPNTWAAASP